MKIKNFVIRFLVLAVCITMIVFLVYAASAKSEQPTKETEETETVETETVETVVAETPETTRTYFDVPLSETVQDRIFDECEKHGINPAIVVALIEQESNFENYCVGDDGRSSGLMQIQTKWHLQRMIELGCTDLFDPCKNVTVGIDYLAELKEQNANVFWVLMAYNGGVGYANEQTQSGNVSNFATSILLRAYELDGGK